MNITSNSAIWSKIPLILDKMPSPGMLLLTGNENEKNVMTVGWLSFGLMWNEPTASILVRPSRYSYKLLEKYNEFTLNLVSDNFNYALNICGSKSGSYCNKFQEANLQIKDSQSISCPSLKDALINIECKIINKQQINSLSLNDLLTARYYASGDFHAVFTGQIVNLSSII